MTVWRVLGIVALVWIGFMVLGAVFKLLMWVLVIGAVVALGAAVYGVISNKDGPRALR
jgi:uncharacterized BrkB/YihY/UPF0761 family membrane protein